MRYVVSECEGRPTIYSISEPGITVIVTDSLVCHRVVGQFRSEDMTSSPHGVATSRLERRRLARSRAEALAERLNETAQR